MHHLLQKLQWLNRTQNWSDTRGPTKTEGDPYQKSIEEFIAFSILLQLDGLLFLELLKIDDVPSDGFPIRSQSLLADSETMEHKAPGQGPLHRILESGKQLIDLQ